MSVEEQIIRAVTSKVAEELVKDKEFVKVQKEIVKKKVAAAINAMDVSSITKTLESIFIGNIEGSDLCDLVDTDKVLGVLEEKVLSSINSLTISYNPAETKTKKKKKSGSK